MVPAQERHGESAVRRHGDHRRLGVLVAEERRQGADEDAAGAHADDGHAGREQAAQVLGGIPVRHVGAVDAMRQTVDVGVGQGRAQAPRQVQAGGTQYDDRRTTWHALAHSHASPRRCTRIMEK